MNSEMFSHQHGHQGAAARGRVHTEAEPHNRRGECVGEATQPKEGHWAAVTEL